MRLTRQETWMCVKGVLWLLLWAQLYKAGGWTLVIPVTLVIWYVQYKWSNTTSHVHVYRTGKTTTVTYGRKHVHYHKG